MEDDDKTIITSNASHQANLLEDASLTSDKDAYNIATHAAYIVFVPKKDIFNSETTDFFILPPALMKTSKLQPAHFNNKTK